ncbi:MAG: diguanylate cyclase domain-containing protein [Beijerinckiaceae bacterium]
MADTRKRVKLGLREADRLSLLRSYHVIDAEPVGAFDDAVALAARICEAQIAVLAFVETRRQWFKASVGLDLPEGPIEGSLSAFAIQKNENLFVVEDLSADPRFARDPVLLAHPGVRFYAGAVLTARDGAALGVLGVYAQTPRQGGLDADQRNALLALAGSVVRELEGRRTQTRAAEPPRHQAAIRTEALAREMSPDQLQKALLLSMTIPWELSLPAERMVLGDNARELIGLGSSISMTRFREHIHVEDQALFDGLVREAMTGSPGEVELRFKRTRGRQAWLRMRAQMLSHFSVTGTFVDVTAERQRDGEAGGAAMRDHLTGLPSRGPFQEQLQKEMRAVRFSRAKLAVLFVDVDDLDDVNAAFGHHAGDAVLREVGRRLAALVGDRGRVGRARDDEFILYLGDAGDAAGVERFCDAALEDLRRPFTFEGNTLGARCSIGAAVFPDHQRDLTRLLQAADTALKMAKSTGRDRACLFSTQGSRELERRAREAQALRIGLARNDILAFYQPIFNVRTGQIVGVEALARWRHPSKGVLAANYFRGAFENPQTAAEITEAMVRSIAADGRMWSSEGLSGLRVALNLSESEVRHPDMAQRILSALETASFPPHHLEVETSEAWVGGHPTGGGVAPHPRGGLWQP